MVYAEILSTGEELLSGSLVDTNSAWIAQNLLQTGVQVRQISCVGDDLHSLSNALQEISRRSDIAILTGGLGPTPDDLTAQAAAMAGGNELVHNEQALQSMHNFFFRLKKDMPASNIKQALLPAGSTCLPNKAGTAPGFALCLHGCYIFALPGVPKEMRQMFSEYVAPEIEKLFSSQLKPLTIREISCFGITESNTSQALQGFEANFPGINLGFRFHFPIIQVRLYARQNSGDNLGHELQEAVSWVAQKLGDKVFSLQGRSLAQETLHLLQSRTKNLVVLEACTGGLLAHLITSAEQEGAQALMLAKVNRAERQSPGIKHTDTAEQAKTWAREIRANTGVDYALSTVQDQEASSRAWVGLADKARTLTQEVILVYPDRQANLTVAAFSALNLLRLELLGRLD